MFQFGDDQEEEEEEEDILDIFFVEYAVDLPPLPVASKRDTNTKTPPPIFYNADGSTRKRNRIDYSKSERRVKAGNPWQVCPWLRLISDPATNNPMSTNGKEFRRKFRVPLPTFQKIVRICRLTEDPIFVYNEKVVGGIWSTPLELKILMVLRTLGSGLKFMDVAELTVWMSETQCNSWFKSFNRVFREKFQSVYIKPLQGNELSLAMKEYAMLGLPGCVGSIDCTFIPWDRCSVNLTNICKGDKGLGLLYEVIVTHFKRVISVNGSFYGTINDKNSVKYSAFVNNLKEKTIYKDVSFKIRFGPENEDCIELNSCYLICDGGYLEWPVLITGFGLTIDPIKYKFTDWVASVRKDVECFFGILKCRFRYLKNPITLSSRDDIDNAFYTACIINNMILEDDGLNNLWESNVNWDKVNPESEDSIDEEYVEEFIIPSIYVEGTQQLINLEDLIPVHELRIFNQEKQEFCLLQSMLANHLQIMYREGLLRWPKSRKQIEEKHNHLPREAFPQAGDLN